MHHDEPWDSPHNIKLLSAMPYIDTCPSDTTQKSGMTGYRVVVGPHTLFPPDFRRVSNADVADGLGTTLLIGESRRSVPWTKPDEIPLDVAFAREGLGSFHGYHNNGFNAVFADGSVRFLRATTSPQVLKALLTRDGKEKVPSN